MSFKSLLILCVLIASFLCGCGTVKKEEAVSPELFSDRGVKKAAEIQESSFAWIAESDWRVVAGQCTTKVSIEAKTSQDWIQIANACAAKKQWIDLQKVATELLARFPESAWGNYYLSIAFEHQGHLEKAIWTIDLAQRKGALWGILNYQKARLHWAKGQFRDAETFFLSALEKDLGLVEANYFLGCLYYRDSEFSKAADHLKKWAAVKPEDSEALKYLAESQVKTGDKLGAIASYEKLTRLLPKNFEFFVKWAVLLETGLDQKERALAVYSQLRNFFGSKGSQGKLEFNLEAKILELEKVVGKGKEKVKSAEPEQRVPASGAKPGGQI